MTTKPPPPTPLSWKSKKKDIKCKYIVEYIVEIDLEKFLQVVLEAVDEEEGFVAIDPLLGG